MALMNEDSTNET